MSLLLDNNIVNITQNKLIKSETINIKKRIELAEDVLNNIMKEYNIKYLNNKNIDKFIIKYNNNNILDYLYQWNGLKIPRNAKLNDKQYLKRSKNWLNGRRAPQYGNTLFPLCLDAADQHLTKIGSLLFIDKKEEHLFKNAVLYQYIVTLLQSNLSVNDTSKPIPFFCQNSVLKKSKLRDKLESLIPTSDNKLTECLPGTIKGVTELFEKISKMYINKYQNYNINNSDNDSKDDYIIQKRSSFDSIANISEPLKKKLKTCNDIDIEMDYDLMHQQHFDGLKQKYNDTRLELERMKRKRDNAQNEHFRLQMELKQLFNQNRQYMYQNFDYPVPKQVYDLFDNNRNDYNRL